MTLEAAQWTFSSDELQAIVSRAIRGSAEPSSIRLLPLKTLDEELSQEIERLETERAQAQAQYRFTMYRRQMLLQSLNVLQYSSGLASSPTTTSVTSNSLSAGLSPAPSPTADLAQRLAEVSGTLDRLAEKLVRTTDQIAQVRSLQEVHAGSALAVALRKLNASYARRIKEIQALKENLATVEEERDEAWRVAEDLAAEVDDGEYDAEVVEGGTAMITQANKVEMHIKTPGVGPRVQQVDISRNGENNIRGSPEEASKLDEPPSSAISLRGRGRANSAATRVTAARTRSIRASKASLRLPRSRGESRPPSAYSQVSASRAISRSRPGSMVASPLDAPSPITPSSGNAVPEVPKMPDAAELARMASVRTNASTKTNASGSETQPPLPPLPLETSPTKLDASFLDMATRPNSATATDEGSSLLKAPGGDTGIGERLTQELESLKAEAKSNSGETVDGRLIDSSQLQELSHTTSATERSKEDDGAQIVVAPHVPSDHLPLSAPAFDTGKVLVRTQARPSLHLSALWNRPKPDSPMDVSLGSDPHRADDVEDDDAEQAELDDVFESAYAQTQARSLMFSRSPHRSQHTQSFVHLSGSTSELQKSLANNTNRPSSPQSERTRLVRDDATGPSIRRPASLPSVQDIKPWTYL